MNFINFMNFRHSERGFMLTIICGAPYSGTSMIAHLCYAHGAWMGRMAVHMTAEEKANLQSKDYEVYENLRFWQLCRNALRIGSDIPQDSLLSEFTSFFKTLPVDRPVVLKYPKACYLLRSFKEELLLDFQVVFVIRNPWKRMVSFSKKEPDPDVTIALKEWEFNYELACRLDVPMLIVAYERFIGAPECETRRLLEFVGLHPDKIDTSVIKPEMKTV